MVFLMSPNAMFPRRIRNAMGNGKLTVALSRNGISVSFTLRVLNNIK